MVFLYRYGFSNNLAAKNMSNFTHIIFDLDGTLTDNTLGISNSVKYALKQMHIDGFSEENMKQFIGPPLQWGFSNLFGLNERNTQLAVEYFREYYGENGWHENVPYPGVLEMIQELDHLGKKMYIATSKLEKYAVKISKHFEFDKYIIQVNGADYSGRKGQQTNDNLKFTGSATTYTIEENCYDW